MFGWRADGINDIYVSRLANGSQWGWNGGWLFEIKYQKVAYRFFAYLLTERNNLLYNKDNRKAAK